MTCTCAVCSMIQRASKQRHPEGAPQMDTTWIESVRDLRELWETLRTSRWEIHEANRRADSAYALQESFREKAEETRTVLDEILEDVKAHTKLSRATSSQRRISTLKARVLELEQALGIVNMDARDMRYCDGCGAMATQVVDRNGYFDAYCDRHVDRFDNGTATDLPYAHSWRAARTALASAKVVPLPDRESPLPPVTRALHTLLRVDEEREFSCAYPGQKSGCYIPPKLSCEGPGAPQHAGGCNDQSAPSSTCPLRVSTRVCVDR